MGTGTDGRAEGHSGAPCDAPAESGATAAEEATDGGGTAKGAAAAKDGTTEESRGGGTWGGGCRSLYGNYGGHAGLEGVCFCILPVVCNWLYRASGFMRLA